MATEERLTVAPIVGPDDPRRFTDSGIEIAPLYTEDDLPADLELGEPGGLPYIRGVHREVYRKPLLKSRHDSGYGSSYEHHFRHKYLIGHDSTCLSVASDQRNQLCRDAFDPRC